MPAHFCMRCSRPLTRHSTKNTIRTSLCSAGCANRVLRLQQQQESLSVLLTLPLVAAHVLQYSQRGGGILAS